MSDKVITVEKLSKAYRIGLKEQKYETMTGAVVDWLRQPFNNLRRVRNLTRFNLHEDSEDTLWALKDVSFDVNQGEVIGIIGRNGAGKSTLLKILSKITEPTSGRVILNGRVSSLLEVGTGFHRELTGRENVYLNGTILGMRKKEIDAKFDEIVDFSGIEKFIDTPVKRYSSGMQVRLAFSVAAHLEPEILIVDEVLAVGDWSFQKKCINKMGEISRKGRTVLIVSHNLESISNLCNSSILLDNGCLLKKGKTQNIIDIYLRRYEILSSYKLDKRNDREGNGAVLFKEVFIKNNQDKIVEYVRSGDRISICLKYEVIKNIKMSHVDVSLSFSDNKSHFLFLLDNIVSGFHFQKVKNSGIFICNISKLPLSAGTYYFNIFLRVNGIIVDWIKNASKLEVIDGDFYDSKRFMPKSHGGVLIEHSWEVL
jgi:lipopolysaccharide transport system ATP-binding protein